MKRMTLAAALSKPIKARDKPYEIRDAGNGSVKGLLLRVQPSGHATFYVELTRGVREKVGPGEITLATARKRASIIIGTANEKGADHFKGKRERVRKAKAATLQGYLDSVFNDHSEEIADFDGMVARVKKSFPDLLSKSMTSITELDLKRWERARKAEVKATTRRRDYNALRAVLNRAVADKIIDVHQINGYKVKGDLGDVDDHGETKLRFLTAEEEGRLRLALDNREADLRADRLRGNAWRRDRNQDLLPEFGPDQYADHIKPMVLLSLLTGLRRGDLFGLKWSHVDLERKQIRKVIEKSSHARRKAGKPAVVATLPLTAEAVAILTQCHRHRDPESEFAFPSPRTGNRLDNVKKGFAAVLTAAGITDFRWHDMRHTFASRLVMAGVDLNTVRELMTHADISMTLKYAHLSPQHKADALELAFSPKSENVVQMRAEQSAGSA